MNTSEYTFYLFSTCQIKFLKTTRTKGVLMKLLILLCLLTTHSFAALNSDSECPEGETLELFEAGLNYQNGSVLTQDVYMCVRNISKCSKITKEMTFVSNNTKSTYKLIEGFQCAQQCQQQQQHNQYQQYQPQHSSHTVTISHLSSVKSDKEIHNIVIVKTNDYIRFNNIMYRCL